MKNLLDRLATVFTILLFIFQNIFAVLVKKLAAITNDIRSRITNFVSANRHKNAVSPEISQAPEGRRRAPFPIKAFLCKIKRWSIKKRIIVSFGSVFAIVIISITLYFLPGIMNPMGQFDSIADQIPKEQPVMNELQSSAAASRYPASQSPSETLDEYGQLIAQGDFGILQKTVNILLIGVDYAPERDTWNGKHDYHSDVMIVLSINKETNDVSLISLPRDTYVSIPGVGGIYKLNASLNCGGEWPSKQACEKVCDAASWMIGGLPVEYYYAVDMSAVKGLVNQVVGSVDFNIPTAFTMDGRSYSAGMQAMDGQAVLDYLRVRKAEDFADPSGETGDLNRINRQKDMLVAIFKKIKDSSLIFKLPELLGAFNGNLVTNVSLAQTAALAAYAWNIDSTKIKLYSMDGEYEYGLFGWNFVITDQSKRVQIIKDVYGIDITNEQLGLQQYGITVPSYAEYDLASARKLWERMQIQVIKNKAGKFLKQVKSKLDADALLPLYPPPSPTETPVPTNTPVPTETPFPTETPVPTDTPLPTETPVPTDTPLPTDTPVSTVTPASTETPASTDSPAASSGESSLLSYSGTHVHLSARKANGFDNVLSPIFQTGDLRKYPADGDVWALYNKAEQEYHAVISWGKRDSSYGSFKSTVSQLQADVEKLGAILGINVSGWGVNYEKAPFNQSIVKNEVAVDFR